MCKVSKSMLREVRGNERGIIADSSYGVEWRLVKRWHNKGEVLFLKCTGCFPVICYGVGLCSHNKWYC